MKKLKYKNLNNSNLKILDNAFIQIQIFYGIKNKFRYFMTDYFYIEYIYF